LELFQKKKGIDKLTSFIFLLNLQWQFNEGEEPASYKGRIHQLSWYNFRVQNAYLL